MGTQPSGTATYLSVDVKGTRLLVQVYVGDAGDLARLLDVGAVRADGQAHQVVPHGKLLVEPRRQLPGTLRGGRRPRRDED